MRLLRNFWHKYVCGIGTCAECPYYVEKTRLIEWERSLQERDGVAEIRELKEQVIALSRYKRAMDLHLCHYEIPEWLNCSGGHTPNGEEGVYCYVCDEDTDTKHPHGKRVALEKLVQQLVDMLAEFEADGTGYWSGRDGYTEERWRAALAAAEVLDYTATTLEEL